MSKLTPVKLNVEDFKDQASWIGKLFTVLNSFTNDLVTAFSNSISIQDNLLQELKDIAFLNSTNTFPLSFKTKFPTVSPQGLIPILVYDSDLGLPSTTAPWVTWTYANGAIAISNISGLTTGHNYLIRLLVVYG